MNLDLNNLIDEARQDLKRITQRTYEKLRWVANDTERGLPSDSLPALVSLVDEFARAQVRLNALLEAHMSVS